MILVDWKDGATKPDYFRSVANTRMVGKQIGMLIEQMDAAHRTHIIGFSLGAQIAGYAGLHLAQNPDSSTGDACNKLHRITGLDPAGPLYEDEDRFALEMAVEVAASVAGTSVRRFVSAVATAAADDDIRAAAAAEADAIIEAMIVAG